MMIDDQFLRRARQAARVADRAAAKPTPILVDTFTPTYFGATTAGVTTYTTQQGQYVRIGPVVFAQAEIIWTNATGTGVIRLGGLPFTSATGMRFPFAQQLSGVTFANGSVEGVLQGAQVLAQLVSPATNAAGTELVVEVAGTIRYMIIYFTEI